MQALIRMFVVAGFVLVPMASLAAVPTTAQRTDWKFTFGPATRETSTTLVTPDTTYNEQRGYGFDLGFKVMASAGGGNGASPGFCTSDHPFFFSVKLPEGNYNVTVTLGDPAGESTTTVKAESRRLMLERIHTDAGKMASRTFTVNIRTANIAGGGQVRLKARERNYLHWDDKLTLEFNGARPCLSGLEIKRADDAITVYLAGDSTVTDQPFEPWNSWGQMLPRFFKSGVAIANHAESGESLGSFLSAHRLDKILSTIKPGDYLFIQMGHNDQKDKAPGAGAFTTYQDRLKQFVSEAKKKQAIPVLVTSMHRRRFDAAGKVVDTLGDFPAAVRQVAKEENIALIDLHRMSQDFYEAMGPDESKKAFVDGTHHNAYGSYELAKCIVEGVRQNKLDLAKFIADDVPAFDPKHPDPIDQFAVPASPQKDPTKPDGN